MLFVYLVLHGSAPRHVSISTSKALSVNIGRLPQRRKQIVFRHLKPPSSMPLNLIFTIRCAEETQHTSRDDIKYDLDAGASTTPVN